MAKKFVIRRTTNQTIHGKKIADSYITDFFGGCPCFSSKVDEARKYDSIPKAEKDRNRIMGWNEHEDICRFIIEEVQK